MNARDYGRHASGYRKADGGPSRRFVRVLRVWLVVGGVCLVWLFTHEACAHPLGNGVAALVAFLVVPLRLVCLFESDE